jgi:heat shock protein HslJ
MRASVTVSAMALAMGVLIAAAATSWAWTEPDALPATLTNAHGVRDGGARLVLVDADGGVVAVADAQGDGIAGTQWQVTGYHTGAQAVVSVLAGTDVSIRFSADGKVSGSAGCNDFVGTYSSSGQTFTIDATATTRKVCAQPEGVMKQEGIFLKALTTVALVRMEGERLELRARNGGLLVRAARSDGARAPTDVPSLLSGELTYMADAARFTDCASGRGYPVAMEADFARLERAYLDAVKEPGAPLYVTFQGRIADRAKIDGEGTEPTVVVDRFVAVSPEGGCKK